MRERTWVDWVVWVVVKQNSFKYLLYVLRRHDTINKRLRLSLAKMRNVVFIVLIIVFTNFIISVRHLLPFKYVSSFDLTDYAGVSPQRQSISLCFSFSSESSFLRPASLGSLNGDEAHRVRGPKGNQHSPVWAMLLRDLCVRVSPPSRLSIQLVQ